MNFSRFLEIKFIDWQRQMGGRKTVSEFADYLGIAQTTASSYMNGKRLPEGEMIRKLAEKLGIEVYDVLGEPRPDEDLYYLSKNWDNYDQDFKRSLREQAEKYSSKKKKK